VFVAAAAAAALPLLLLPQLFRCRLLLPLLKQQGAATVETRRRDARRGSCTPVTGSSALMKLSLNATVQEGRGEAREN
jgi:hypothetical protein